MDKYAKEFARSLTASGVSSAELAQSIGVDPSYVSQWKTGRRPIPIDTARAVAAMIHADPALISKSYEEFLQTLGSAPLSQSLPMQLDSDIVLGVARAMQDVFDSLRVKRSVFDTAVIFAELCNRVGASGITTADVVWLAKRVEHGDEGNAGGSNLSDG